MEGILTQILQLPSGASPSKYAKKNARSGQERVDTNFLLLRE